MPKGCNRLCSDSYVYLEEGVAHCFQVDVPILYASLYTSMRGRPLPPNRDQVHRICKQVKLERVTTGVEGGEEDEGPAKVANAVRPIVIGNTASGLQGCYF